MTEDVPGIEAAVILSPMQHLAMTGVYFLLREGTVVYVGQAVDIRRRVAQHIGEGVKAFDTISAVACPVKRLDQVERHYIEKFVPEYNRCRLSNALRTACSRGNQFSLSTPLWEPSLGLEEAAAFLGVDTKTFLEWTRSGDGPPGRRRSRSRARCYRPTDLREFAKQKALAV